MAQRDDAVGGLLRALRDFYADEQIIADMIEEFGDLHRKLPAELRTGEEALDLLNPATLSHSIDEVKQLLLVRIFSPEEGR